MLVVKIELWPHGIETRKRELKRMFIANVGGSERRGDYVVRAGTRTGTVENYPRLSYNVWRLVTRALLSAFPEERKTR